MKKITGSADTNKKLKRTRYYPMILVIGIVIGILLTLFLPSSMGLMGVPVFLMLYIYAPTIIPLAIISYFIKSQKTAVVLNRVITVIILLPIFLVGAGILTSFMLSGQ